MEPLPNTPPVLNGFDENAVEAALRIKDRVEARITVLSAGKNFARDVMKKPLSMGCDELLLVEDDALEGLDALGTARVLAAAIRKMGGCDLILSGRQASDGDQAMVPLALAELLGLPCITLAQRVEVKEGSVVADRTLPDGHESLEAPLPALVTVSNELGQPRYPILRGVMAASRKEPTVWSLAELGLEVGDLRPQVETLELFVPAHEAQCTFIDGESDEEKGRCLAQVLREARLI